MIEQVTALIQEPIEKAGYRLDEVLYLTEDGLQFLRVVIDKDGFIDVEDCVVVTNIVSPILDLHDPITDNYILDVCSKEKGCD